MNEANDTLNQHTGGPAVPPDVAKSAGIGVVKGAIGTVGMLPDLAQFAKKGVDYAATSLGASPETVNTINQAGKVGLNAIPGVGYAATMGPGSQKIQSTIEAQTGKFYEPKTTAGAFAEKAGEFLPAAAMGPGGLGRRVLTQAILPSVASEGAGQIADRIDPCPHLAVPFPAAANTLPQHVWRFKMTGWRSWLK
jgi:hypothetical protein